MYCRYCGKEIEDNAKFCKYCGKSQDGSSHDEDEISKNPYMQQATANAGAQIDARVKKHFDIRPGTNIIMETLFNTITGLPCWISLAVFVFYAIITSAFPRFSIRHFGLEVFFAIVLLAIFVYFLMIYLRVPLSVFAITEKRLLIRVWPGQKIDVPIDEIEQVTVTKGFFKNLNCGNLQITAGGQTYYFRSVACAETFKDALIKQMNRTV